MFTKKTKLIIAVLIVAALAKLGLVPLSPETGLAVKEVVDVIL